MKIFEGLKKKKYEGFTMIEMIIVMGLIFIVFVAFASVLTSLMRASNTVSARILVRQEGEYLSEVFRKHIRNANHSAIRVYRSRDPDVPGIGIVIPDITFEYDEDENIVYSNVESLRQTASTIVVHSGRGTELHFRPSGNTDEVVCIGYFEDTISGRGYIARSKTTLPSTWQNYEPSDCFIEENSSGNQEFRKNFMVLNSDLVNIDDFEVHVANISGGPINNYYTFTIKMTPQLGLGGFSNYNETNLPQYVKTFVVQTRAYTNW